MKRYAHILAALIIIASIGCKSYSKYTIDETPMVKIDTNMLGIWKAIEDTSRQNFIIIQNFSDVFGYHNTAQTMPDNQRIYFINKYFTYYITYMDMHGKNPHFQQWDGFLSMVNNVSFLNIDYRYTPYVDGHFISEKSEEGFFFVRILNINSTNNIMTTCIVADPNMKHLQNSAQVRSRITAYLNKPYFYSDTLHWYRVSKYHASLKTSRDIANPR